MDKLAKLLRDRYNIPYTGALELKRSIFARPDFREKAEQYKSEGKTVADLVADLAAPLVESQFHPES